MMTSDARDGDAAADGLKDLCCAETGDKESEYETFVAILNADEGPGSRPALDYAIRFELCQSPPDRWPAGAEALN
jgi:hypothetical protein